MKFYVVDAFAKRAFEGNPAAVCVMEQWVSEELMQNIASECNQPVTAFAVKRAGAEADADAAVCYSVRYFTAVREIELCGHATLATAYILGKFYHTATNNFVFATTKRGELKGVRIVDEEGAANAYDTYELNLPAGVLSAEDEPANAALDEALGARTVVRRLNAGRDMICVLESGTAVRDLKPDLAKLAQLTCYGNGLHVTALPDAQTATDAATGEQFDCISRAFFPRDGNEDPVCGAAHCSIIPYWASVSGKTVFAARQVSARGGTLYCALEGDRLRIKGHAVLYAEGTLCL